MRLAVSMTAAQGGLAAQVVIVEDCAQLKQGSAPASYEFDGGAEVGLACVGVGVGVGPKSQQFGVVEAHPGVAGQRQSGVQVVAGLLGLADGN
jgi:hypothetical protein